jgi:hypothetical protein
MSPTHLSIASGSGYAQAVLSDGPVGYWRMDAPSGTTELDRSGNGHDGTITGGVTLNQAGALSDGDAAALFSAGQITGALASVPSAYTFEVWVNHQGVAWSGSHEMPISTDTTAAYLSVLNGSVFASILIGGVQTTLNSGASVPTTGWHHLVVTWNDGGDKKLRMYFDGSLMATGSATGAGSPTITAFWIGNDGGVAFNFNGTIDEAAIYASALSAQQVATHYALRNGCIRGRI